MACLGDWPRSWAAADSPGLAQQPALAQRFVRLAVAQRSVSPAVAFLSLALGPAGAEFAGIAVVKFRRITVVGQEWNGMAALATVHG